MLGSWKIARLLGIDVRLHWTFLLLVPLVLAPSSANPMYAFGLCALFASVLVHELGHSLVARRFGIRVVDITFWPLGGMARMTEIPEEPRVEGWVAIAGPLVNFAVVALTAPLLVATELLAGPQWLSAALTAILVINLLLGTFNLVPAFPMDGGRLLRAFFARRAGYVEATARAVRVGRTVALGMIALAVVASIALATPVLCSLPLIALFVWYAGGRELVAVRLRHGLPPFGGVAFGPFAFGGAPAADPSGPFGAPRDVELAREPAAARTPPAEAGPRRPEAWDGAAAPPRGGFSEETLRRLERYPGRLQRPPRDPLEE